MPGPAGPVAAHPKGAFGAPRPATRRAARAGAAGSRTYPPKGDRNGEGLGWDRVGPREPDPIRTAIDNHQRGGGRGRFRRPWQRPGRRSGDGARDLVVEDRGDDVVRVDLVLPYGDHVGEGTGRGETTIAVLTAGPGRPGRRAPRPADPAPRASRGPAPAGSSGRPATVVDLVEQPGSRRGRWRRASAARSEARASAVSAPPSGTPCRVGEREHHSRPVGDRGVASLTVRVKRRRGWEQTPMRAAAADVGPAWRAAG
ncbi:hypothetical protein SCALM49S_04650 [Streptomyces californicus]